jgi:hypothetical protein
MGNEIGRHELVGQGRVAAVAELLEEPAGECLVRD